MSNYPEEYPMNGTYVTLLICCLWIGYDVKQLVIWNESFGMFVASFGFVFALATFQLIDPTDHYLIVYFSTFASGVAVVVPVVSFLKYAPSFPLREEQSRPRKDQVRGDNVTSQPDNGNEHTEGLVATEGAQAPILWESQIGEDSPRS